MSLCFLYCCHDGILKCDLEIGFDCVECFHLQYQGPERVMTQGVHSVVVIHLHFSFVHDEVSLAIPLLIALLVIRSGAQTVGYLEVDLVSSSVIAIALDLVRSFLIEQSFLGGHVVRATLTVEADLSLSQMASRAYAMSSDCMPGQRCVRTAMAPLDCSGEIP